MSATIKTIVTLFTITLLSLAVSIYSSYKLKASNDELVKVNSVGLDYQAFKSTWLNKEYSKNHIDALTADMGKGYFSAVVTKKELKGDIYTVGIMVLNYWQKRTLWAQIIWCYEEKQNIKQSFLPVQWETW